jgi:short-subunit dehydrogenase
VALVTGSAGDRTRNPRDLAAAGARVMAVSRTEADLISLHAEIGGAYLASR